MGRRRALGREVRGYIVGHSVRAVLLGPSFAGPWRSPAPPSGCPYDTWSTCRWCRCSVGEGGRKERCKGYVNIPRFRQQHAG
eukprot:scaffold44261_cov18-Tisochrysis_lutea.AAC.2